MKNENTNESIIVDHNSEALEYLKSHCKISSPRTEVVNTDVSFNIKKEKI